MAKTINLGKVGLTFEGDYDSSKNYASRTCVFYNHVSWASKRDVPAGIAPGSNYEYWQKISDRGAQGATGTPGQSYVDKELVPIVDNLTTGGSSNVLSAEQGKVLKSELTELESKVGVMSEMIDIAKEGDSAIFEFERTNKFALRIDTSILTQAFLYLRKDGEDNFTIYNNYQNFATNTLHTIELAYDVTGAKVYFNPNGSGQANISLQMGQSLAILKNAKDIETNANGIEMNAQGILSVQSEVDKNEDSIKNLRASLLGGKEYYINRVFDIQGQWIDANSVSESLSEPKSDFTFKFSVPEDSDITQYGLYLYESNETRHAFGLFDVNTDIYFDDHGFKVAKIAVSNVDKNNPHTGVFQLEVFNETDGEIKALEGKVDELESEVEKTDNTIQDLTSSLLGGKEFYINEEFNLQNQYVDANSISAILSEPKSDFMFKFIVPDGVTAYQLYLYDTAGSKYEFGPFEPNTDIYWHDHGYQIAKIVVAKAIPDDPYTGVFQLEAFNETDGKIQSIEGKVNELENKVIELESGVKDNKKYYIDKEFNLQNQYVDANSIIAELSEPKSTFKFKFSVPGNSDITQYAIYAYKADDTRQYFGPFDSNKEIDWTEHGYSISKIAIASTYHDNTKYTGIFRLEVYDEVEDLEGKVNELDLKINGGNMLTKKALSANNEFVNASNLSVDLAGKVRTFNVKLSVPSDSGITGYAIYAYDISGKGNYLDNLVPGETKNIELDYDVNKIAVATPIPDNKYTGTFELEVGYALESAIVTKEEFENKVDYEPREFVPSYYFDNDYLPNKVATIRDLLENCMANGDAFFFQTDEHWEQNAQRGPALVKYIADQLNIGRLFDGGDTTHNIDAYNYPHASPDAIDFETLRYRTFNGRVYHAMGNHEYLTWGHKEPNKWQGVNFGNWHDWMYYQRKEVADIVVADNNKHYYYVDNPQKKIRYIILSSYKTKQEPIISGDLYYTIAEFDYGEEQLRWFTEEALNVEQGWTMFVFTHNFCSFTAGAKDGEGYISDVSPYISDAPKQFAKAMLQYNGNGEIAAVFQGHLHVDALFSINDSMAGLTGDDVTGKNIPCVATSCDAYDFDHLGDEEKLYNREKDTITEQVVDCVVVDKTSKKLTIVRIGAPAYNILTQSANGKYPLFGDMEIREVNWGAA